MKLLIALFIVASTIACAREGAIATDRSVRGSAEAVHAIEQGPVIPPVPSPIAEPTERPNGSRTTLKHLRLSTPAEKVQWERAVDALWKTPLGQLYSEYLFTPTPDHADLPLWARMLAARVYREPNFLPLRISALVIMSEDLYVREKRTADVANRQQILHEHLSQKEDLAKQRDDVQYGNAVSGVVAGSLAYASPAVRGGVRRVGARMKNFAKGDYAAAKEPLRLTSMVTDFRQDWDTEQALKFLGASTLALQAVPYAYNNWYFPSSIGPKDKSLLLGLDDLVKAMDVPGNLSLPADFYRGSR